MSRRGSAQEETLAKAAVVFCQKVYTAFPGASVEPIDPHYTDEDLTLAVQVPAGTDVRQASDELITLALEIEDRFGVAIVTRAVGSGEP
jgi:hypothetical protein